MNSADEQNAGLTARRFFWGILIAIFVGSVVWHAWVSAYDRDEIEHLHAAWLIGQGLLPYADFLEQHHPTFWYLLAPLTHVFTTPQSLIFFVRALQLAGLALFLVPFSRLCRHLVPGIKSRWPTLLLVGAFMFTRNMMEIRPDPWMNLCLFVGLCCWMRFLEGERSRHAWHAGFLFGLAAVILQKALVIMALVGIATCFIAIRQRAHRRRLITGLVCASVSAALPLALLVVAMLRLGIADDFFFWNYTFNRYFYLAAHVPAHFSPLETWWRSFLQSPVLWCAGIAGLVVMGKNLKHNGQLVVLVLALGHTIFIAINRFPLAQYFLPLFPLLALSAAFVFKRWQKQRWLQALTLLATLECVVILLAYPANAEYRVAHNYVLSHSTVDDRVFIPCPYHPIFRYDSSYLWYNTAMMGNVYADYCRRERCTRDLLALEINRWEKTPPVFLYIDPAATKDHPTQWPSAAESRVYAETGIPYLLRLKMGERTIPKRERR